MSVVSPQPGAGAALAALSPISHRDDAKGVNGTKADQPNGLQNGYSGSDKHRSSHKSSSKDKHRDKDRDRDRDKDRDREKDPSKRSSGGDRDRHSDKDRKRDKDRSDRDKDRSRSDKDRDRSKRDDKEKSEKHRSSDDKNEKSSDRHKSSSGSSKDKDKDRKSHSSKDKDGKDRHRSKKDEHRSKHTSSSSRHSDGHSSSKDKSHSSNKDKQSSSSHHESPKISVKKEEIKEEIENNLLPETKHEPALSEEEMEWNSPEPAVPEPAPVKIENDIAESEEDMPLNVRKNKRKIVESDEEDAPILPRKPPKAKKMKKEKKEPAYESDEYASPKKKKAKPTKVKKELDTPTNISPTKRKKKQEDEAEVWKWWEEEKKDDGTKWTYLEHKGPLFAPLYERIPKSVVFRYDGKEIPLSEESEEVAGFYAKMLENDYATKDVFNENFFNDWRKIMTDKEKSVIKDLRKCDFKVMHAYFMDQAEKNRNKSKDEKAALKAKNEEIQKEYGFCTIDGHKEKIGNFRIEPPGLFRGRGEHPKMGMLKKRVEPEHITINCSKDSNTPKPPSGRKWKEVRHDNSVTWLASWTENVQGQVKYVMLNPSSKLKGEKDWQKYETARKLAGCVEKIRETYREEWKAKEMRIRQRAVALYFIDKLALRAGNEKDEDQADTVGCCSLRVEHIELHKEKDGKENVVVFDFLGKDSIRYYNEVPVEKRVFKNLELFKENKKTGDDLFDRLNTQTMNEHLRELMPNLTAKVFRTFNASFTLQNQLNELTDTDSTIEEKILAYNRANRAVAVLCNHQRAVPKGHQKSMDALKEKIQAKRDQVTEAEEEVRDLTRMARKGSVKEKMNADKKKKALQRLQEQLRKLEVQETDRDENKTIALGTSKLNYLDPRISIAWCKKHGVPIEKIYNKTQRDKFRWAIDMATVDYVF